MTNVRCHRAVGVAGEPSRRPVPAEGGGEKRERHRWPPRDDRPLHDSQPRWMGVERLRWTGCSSPVPGSPSRSCRRPVRESDCGNLVRRSRVMRRSHVNRTHPALCAAFIQRTMATADMIRVCGGARVRAAGAGLARCRPVGSAGHDSTSSIEPEYFVNLSANL